MKRIGILQSACFIGFFGLFSNVAMGDTKEQAQTFLDKGNEEVLHGDYLHALEDFQNAYGLFPSPKILLNLGTTYRQLGRNAEALDAYDKYLAASDVDEEHKPEVRDIEATLLPKVGTLHVEIIDSRPKGATPVGHIEVDAKPAGGGALVFDIRVDVGPHSVEVTLGDSADAKTVASNAVVVGGKTATAHLELRPDAVITKLVGGDIREREEAEKAHSRANRRAIGIASSAVGLAGFVVAGITGGLILQDRSKVDQSCPASLHGACRNQAGLDAAKQGRTLIPINGVGWALGAVGVGVGIPLIVTSLDPKASSSKPAARLILGPSSLGIAGEY